MEIATGGMQKQEMERAAKKACPKAETIITADMGAAPLLKGGRTDYYFGAYESGGGAAISILIGLMGYGKYCTICKNGGKPNEEEIRKYVKDRKVYFGMTVSSIDGIVSVLMKTFLEQKNH